jgi:hypothetical protein
MTKKKRQQKTDAKLRTASISLWYEVSMLNAMAKYLSARVRASEQAAHNALVESFVVHTRILIEFFYPKDLVCDTTMIAADYVPDWKEDIPEWLDKVRKRAHTRLAHLTYDRVHESKDNEKWDERVIGKHLNQLMSKFMAEVSLDRICDELKKYCAEIGITAHHEGCQNA